MNITVKANGQFKTKVGIDVHVIEASMKKLLKKKPHLCASCASVACGEHRGLQNAIVKKGVRTDERDYIIDCEGYKKGIIMPDDQKTNDDYPKTYRIVKPTVRKAIDRMK